MSHAPAPPAAPTPTSPTTAGLLPRGYSTPACRTGGDRWPDLHQYCNAPGYHVPVVGYVKVACACTCHGQVES